MYTGPLAMYWPIKIPILGRKNFHTAYGNTALAPGFGVQVLKALEANAS